jgi:hypothetical protein
MAETVKRMDRSEITKRIERAEKLLQKGKTAEALEDYLQVLAAEPGTIRYARWRPICAFRCNAFPTP